MKIAVKVAIFLGLVVNIFGANYDYVKFYDADRTENEIREDMSKELKLFITSEANATLIAEYKAAELVLTPEELEAKEETDKEAKENQPKEVVQKTEPSPTQTITDEKVVEDEEAGFFARMLSKIGIGSTKKIVPAQSSSTSVEKKEVKDEK